MKSKKLLLMLAPFGAIGMAFGFDVNAGALGKLSVDGAVSGFYIYSNEVPPNSNTDTGIDKKNRYDISNGLVDISKPDGIFRFTVIAGAYNMPMIGMALNKTTQSNANTDLFSALPVAYVEIDPNAYISIKAGKLPTMIGYESMFDYQDTNIQRGLIWSMQPAVSDGIRFTYTKGIFTGNIEINDGFYSQEKPALEGSFSLAPNSNASIAFNFIYPDKSTKPNPTSTPANKQEYELLGSYTYKNLTLALDAMYIHVPTDTDPAVDTTSNHAEGEAFYATYNINPSWNINTRLEYVEEGSSGTDIIGFGYPGTHADDITITPEYKYKQFFVRSEVSYVHLYNISGDVFSDSSSVPIYNKNYQWRFGVEAGFVF